MLPPRYNTNVGTPLRRTVVRSTLADQQPAAAALRRLSPDERVAMVWQLTLQAHMFREGHIDEPRLRRDVVRIVRGGR